MSYYPEPIPQKPSMMKRLVGIIILMAMFVITALVIIYGFTIDTIFDYNLQSNALFSKLPAAAQNAFNSNVSYQLTTFDWVVIVVILLAIGGTVAAVFGLAQSPEDVDDYASDY